jgi:hypothetical protein
MEKLNATRRVRIDIMKIKVRWVGFFSMHVRESSGFRVQVLKKNQEMDGN